MGSAPDITDAARSAPAGRAGGLMSWLQLIRLPNAFTVPGDVLAGFCLAGGMASSTAGSALLLIAASLSIYWAGLILNDCFDRERDRKERPDRPLPSGRISAKSAWAAGASLLVIGILLATLTGRAGALTAGALVLFVLFYDGAARAIPALGFLTMGLCRGMNLLLGASVARWDQGIVFLATGVLTAYIVAVTAAAASETEGPPKGPARWAPFGVLAVGLPVLWVSAPVDPALGSIAVSVLALTLVFRVVKSFEPALPAAAVPPKIGALIRALIPLQASFLLAVGGPPILALVVLALLPLSGVAGRRFYGS